MVVDADALLLSSILSAMRADSAHGNLLSEFSETLLERLDLVDEAPSLWTLLSHYVAIFGPSEL
jgi:hypothetical protein